MVSACKDAARAFRCGHDGLQKGPAGSKWRYGKSK